VQSEVLLVTSLLASSVASLGLSLLLVLEQQRSPKPSDLAVLYLFASIICDAVLLTMPSESLAAFEASHPAFLRCIINLAIFGLECCKKTHLLGIPSEHRSPEEFHSVFGRVLYIWINPILFQGYQNVLVDQDLPALGRDMGPELTRNAINQAWSQRS